jgi:AraC-like DNA-binding protein
MSPSPHAFEALPLPFGNQHARVEHDPDHLAQRVSRAVPLRDLSPRKSVATFVHRSVHVQAGPLGITAAAHSSLHGTNHSHAKAVFTLPILGEKRFQIGRHNYRVRAGHGALFIPGEAYSLETSHCSGVMFSLCPKALAAVAATIAGPESSLRFIPIDRPVAFLERHPQQGKVLALLRRSLQLIDLACLSGTQVPNLLGLDDKLQRLMALLLYPQLMASAPAWPHSVGPRERAAFEALLDAIQQDLLADWSLTRMQRQASLSRLQLLQQFQATFDCPPLEWLRHQRLCLARQQLQAAAPISLRALALQCGYADAESFRQHFAHHFSVLPESLRPDLAP